MVEPALAGGWPLALLAGVGGALLGLAFHGGLWWTVRRGTASPRAALWFIASGVLRTGGALAAILWIGQGHWERLALCMAGFAVAHVVVVRWAGLGGPESIATTPSSR